MKKVSLTDKQIVVLGWDDPGIPSPRVSAKKRGATVYELTEEELKLAIETAEGLSWGADDTRTAKAILRKLL